MQTAQRGWGAKAESIEGYELAGKALALGWVYAPLGVPIGGGVHLSIFPRFFKKRSPYGIRRRQLLLRGERVNGRAREVKARVAQL